jgi:hypothetical protein
MAKMKTECSCGTVHEFEGEAAKYFEGSLPDYIECSECPVCSPDLLDKPENHEDEAYKEEIDIEKLDSQLDLGLDPEEDEADEEEY